MEQDKKMRKAYRTTNWCEYNASLKARGSLTVWLDKEMQWLAEPNGKRGRNQTFSDAAIQFCLSVKVLFGQPLRQSLGVEQSLLKLAKLDWPVPDFSTVSRRQWRTRFTWGLMRRHWRSAPLRSRTTAWAMRRCCPS